MRVTYNTNNSGGGWWLDDEDWHALEAAGWNVDWVATNPRRQAFRPGADRWLGALATSAFREGLSLEDAILEFEKVTGESYDDEGCPCCGPPHSFYEEPDIIQGELVVGELEGGHGTTS